MKSIIWMLFAIMFVIGTDTFIVSPLLPLLDAKLAIPIELSGWLVSAYAIGYCVTALFAGPLSDRWNRKSSLMIGLAAFALFTAGCGLAFNFWSLFLFRLLAGISAAFVSPQVWASIPQLVPQHQIMRAMGITSAGLACAQCFGVPLGSYLSASHWQTPFVVIGVLALLLIGIVYAQFPNLPAQTLTSGHAVNSISRMYHELLRKPHAIRWFAGYFIFTMGMFAVFSFIGHWLTDTYKLTVSQIGTFVLVIGAGNLIGSLLASHVAQHGSRRRVISLLITGMIAGFIVVAYSTYLPLAASAYFALTALGGILFPLLMMMLQSLHSEARGMIAALANAMMYGGTTVGAACAGILYTVGSGFTTIIWFTMVCYLIALILFRTKDDISVSNISLSKVSLKV
ncbi:MFS transporter [Paenibacillus sp. UMB4589-SE434]|uniref:MFS transporter n=1 Tax=Paenibacillus sp. UMB4589-SE434 TaxID=3046314 RepID=UPI0025518A02|nr:MFS transporter [Paenibacillus sp. UMB4589-SE434]MDK8183002.1 MFS transporter [Paenibacillus sp. UMB4589-SE434]